MTKFLLSRQLNDYAERYSSEELPVLAELNRETNMKRGDAVMLSGHLQGSFIQMISHMARPRRILEIGTYTGYSAICLAQGLQDSGLLHTIEIDEELHDIGARYFSKAGLSDIIVQHTGNALEIIPTLDESFDLVFIDADKTSYGLYYDMIFDKVPIGGYIVADNVLYDGEVIMPDAQQGKNAKAISQFNNKVREDKRIMHVLVPVRDGIMVMRKIAG
jgi:predicted O-methyltransferase YrrM